MYKNEALRTVLLCGWCSMLYLFSSMLIFLSAASDPQQYPTDAIKRLPSKAYQAQEEMGKKVNCLPEFWGPCWLPCLTLQGLGCSGDSEVDFL